jgi:membrane-bound lytic murein transglycosylase
MSESDKMEEDTASTSSSMSIESNGKSYEMEVEEILTATQQIVDKLNSVEKYLANVQTAATNAYTQPTYIIVSPTGQKTELKDALDILQSTSDASNFGSNILAFLQSAKDIIIGTKN